ncbi:hypothetical protein EJB05_31860 [Eragrostis curvula]|uniref:Glyceraldehyde 3-phosphate dehydrogenase NAD(P) binding domain-containing protein n=1 Tax=Eragrostis curvula TaxID=38414 RepID=A0A5J9UGA3_9POAL|nr:hypothetical protein EJB05_31860 [Eragrostis curvula]
MASSSTSSAERASSSSTCSEERASSSSAAAPAPPATIWFPSSMTGESLQLSVRNVPYTGRVDFVDELKSLVKLKVSKLYPRFFNGDAATLENNEGRRWLGELIAVDDDEVDKKTGQPSLHTTLQIRLVPPAAKPLESMENVLVTVKPVTKLESSQEGVKVGIKGFGKAERFLLVMGLQSIDVEVVAIHAPSMSTAQMAKVWKSPIINISVKNSETLIFTKRYYEENPRKENDVCVLLEHMEVTVFRDPNQIPWESANVDFILECSINTHKDDQSQVIGKTEASNNCLKCFPKVLHALGLYADGIMRARLHNANDDHEPARRAARFNIITRSSAAAKAVCHPQIFPDWNGDPTSMAFLATARLTLQVTLVKAEDCSRVESSETKLCDADEGVYRRLIAIMSWCLDIIRCMPVGSCHLELA